MTATKSAGIIELVYIDSYLRDFSGHYYSYAKAVIEEAIRKGTRCRVLCHKHFHSTAGKNDALHLEFTFQYIPPPVGDNRRYFLSYITALMKEFLFSNLQFYRDLKHLHLIDKTVVFFPNVDIRVLPAITFWIVIQRPIAKTFVLLFRYDIKHSNSILLSFINQTILSLFLFIARLFDLKKKIRIASDSSIIAADLERISLYNVSVLPIPHTYVYSDESSKHTGSQITFSTLGDLREEKGFGILVEAIERLKGNKLFSDCLFTLQCYSNNRYPKESESRDRLEAMQLPNVQLIKIHLEEKKYIELMRNSDVVILPYCPKTYRSRTSGPFIEALALGSAVIVPDQTWMSEQLLHMGSGLTFSNNDPNELAKAILTAIHSIELLRARAWEVRNTVGNIHSARHFMDRLTESVCDIVT